MSGVSPEPAQDTAAFRPDIEGLRAVAVILVIGYHAAIPPLTGGFVGVDVFFVLSGFLITGLLVRELADSGRVDLVRFYARRARRLLPAAMVAIVVTVAVSAVVLPPLQVPDVALDGAAAALYVSNLRFAAQATDYLQSDFDPSPLLHFWSLGVEEQFYLFWPLLLIVAAKAARSSARAFAVVVAVSGLISLGLSLAMTTSNAPLAFFLLPTRWWELALGALVYLGAARLAQLPAASTRVLPVVGLLLIVAAAIAISPATPYPGWAALVPTIGAALVIGGGMGPQPGLASRLLGVAPARWIGRISYSLYLWHWPLIILPAIVVGQELPGPARLALALATVPIAALSFYFVEDPIRRRRRFAGGSRRTLAMAGAGSAAVATFTLSLAAFGVPGTSSAVSDPSPGGGGLTLPETSPWGAGDGYPSLPPTVAAAVPANLVPPLATARRNIPRIFGDGCHVQATEVAFGECAYGDLNASTTVVLFGDSHAAQWFPTLERIASQRHWRLLSLTKDSCPAADIDVWSPSLKRPYAECREWQERVLARIAAERPAAVILSNTRMAELVIDGRPVDSVNRDDIWGPAVARMIRALSGSAGRVVLIGDTPNPTNDPPVCLSASPADALNCATPVRDAVAPARTATDENAAVAEGATFVDPTAWICPSDPCPVIVDGYLVYRDTGHIAMTYAEALAPYLTDRLPPIP